MKFSRLKLARRMARIVIRNEAKRLNCPKKPDQTHVDTDTATSFLCKKYKTPVFKNNQRKTELLLAAAIKARGGQSGAGPITGSVPVLAATPIIKSASEAAEFYASWEWKRARYDALKREGARCQCCGAGRDKSVIAVDHIKPLRLHWQLRVDQSNLQVLCECCNMGKGSRDETDWR